MMSLTLQLLPFIISATYFVHVLLSHYITYIILQKICPLCALIILMKRNLIVNMQYS